MKAKILTINPPNRPYSERSLLIEPIDMLATATYAKALGHEVEAVDMDVKKMAPKTIEKKIESMKPDVTIIIFDYHIPLHTSKAIPGVNKICQIARKHSSKTIIAGKTPKHCPELFLGKGTDVIVNGEIELPLKELLETEEWNAKSLAKIKGISFMEKGKIITTAQRTDKVRLDSLPIPDRDLVDMDDYIGVRTIWTSRGCFGKCGFCATPKFWGCWRAMGAERVVDEIEHLTKTYKAKKVLFLDDNATVSRERMRRICTEIIRRKIRVKLGCLGTISTSDKDTLKLMKKAGFSWIHYGAESACQKVLDKLHKCITPEDTRKAIKETKEAGLKVRTSWIFDLPGIDDKGLKDTVDLILETEPEEIRAHFLALRVGTEFYKKGKMPSQYIHSSKPEAGFFDKGKIMKETRRLVRELKKKGYIVVEDIKQWRDLEKLKKKDQKLRFISFCPARYGLWEE
jgi:radical SAM superfamily enzyme YgiQ (UPF0313 family)